MHSSSRKKILLISNKVFHYRIPVYEHLNTRLASYGYELVVLANEVERKASQPSDFQLLVKPFRFRDYWRCITEIEPRIVIFFLHARDFIVWPLLVALKLRSIDVIYWNHGINLKTPDSKIKRIVLFVANNTINFNTIPEVAESKSSIRQELGITFSKVVLFVGRVTPEKRLDDLLAAAPALDNGIGIVVVGEGLSARQEQEINASTNIVYLGGIYDPLAINRVFKMADLFSIPGKVGLGVNQAFYWGLPIVTEDVLHSPEIVYVRDGVNGFIVEQHNVKMLAMKINYLLTSEEKYRQFSDAARAEIRENASIDNMCDGFLDAVRYLEERSNTTGRGGQC